MTNGPRYQLQQISHRHEAIMNWLIANPDKSLGECAAFFRYTQAWITQVVHSDMFQAQYRQRCDELGQLVVHTMGSKLTGAMALALDETAKRLASGVASEKFVSDSTRNLGALAGFVGKPADPVRHEHVHLHVDADALTRAKERAANYFRGTALTMGEEVPAATAA